MDNQEEWAKIAYENWCAAFSKMPPVPYLEAALHAIVAVVESEATYDDTVKSLCDTIAFAAREAASEGHGIEYMDNSLREDLERKAKNPAWRFLQEHLREAGADALRVEEDRMWNGDEEEGEESWHE